MIKCGGCGRDIDPQGMDSGSRYLCVRCYHLQTAGQEPLEEWNCRAFLAIAIASLVAIGLAGIALCILYLSGTGKMAWFVLLLALALSVAVCPAAVLLKRRNLSLLVACLFLPMGIWSYLWHLAPGVDWGYGKSATWGTLGFLAIALFTLYLFLRDLRTLPRF